MSNNNGKADYNQRKDRLLKLQTPEYRRGYSDRTSWLMACLSELAYLNFSSLLPEKIGLKSLKESLGRVSESATNASEGDQKILNDLIAKIEEKYTDTNQNLGLELKALKSVGEHTCIDEVGTQAIWVEFTNYYVLAFRGTEKNHLSDIKTDMKMVMTECSTGGLVHSGFKTAYEDVEKVLLELLSEKKTDKPVYITGHSLGGALAVMATKRLPAEVKIASCYTFGSPRVGDVAWVSNIKTPIYRIVNAADVVTMLPPSGMVTEALAYLLGWLPWGGSWIKGWLLSKVNGYMHGGNMRYLTNCVNGNYEQVKLLYSVSFLYRIKMIILKGVPTKKFIRDHSISVYREKLAVRADQRNL